MKRLIFLLGHDKLRRIFRAIIILSVVCIVALKFYYVKELLEKVQKQYLTPDFLESPVKHIVKDEIFKSNVKKNNDGDSLFNTNVHSGRYKDLLFPENMLDTEGCKIPLEIIDYANQTKNMLKINHPCGKRAVFVTKFDDDKVKFSIKPQDMHEYFNKTVKYECCYRFIVYQKMKDQSMLQATYRPCNKIKDKALVKMESDFINVRCLPLNESRNSQVLYDDYYAFSKKTYIPKHKSNTSCDFKYNVLMIGMDTMSTPRLVDTMPRVKKYLQDNHWLTYQGYHKVAENSFPNLVTALTGKNYSNFWYCQSQMDKCLDFLIWKKFSDDGYVTAYGEDILTHTFIPSHRMPAHHFIRPLLMKGVRKAKHDEATTCLGTVSSGQQVLDYAFDFANTYRNDAFFGFFWLSSFSHDMNHRPENADALMESFFNRLSKTGVLKNTFVIFFSDHGLRLGELRIKMQGYYDERLPMFSIQPATYFKTREPSKYESLAFNRYKLATPYDLYSTLLDIKRISFCDDTSRIVPEGCAKCHSMFEMFSDKRTCEDVGIFDNWCSCHKMLKLPDQDEYRVGSVDTILSYINQGIDKYKTKKCWSCAKLTLRRILRTHYYEDYRAPAAIFYVMALETAPRGVVYEATVYRKIGSNDLEVFGSISSLTPYGSAGFCTVKKTDDSYIAYLGAIRVFGGGVKVYLERDYLEFISRLFNCRD